MPGLDGIAATREIARDPALAGVHVLIMTTFGLDEYIFEALRAGQPASWSKTPTRPSTSGPSR
jgi:DNA-binding NarL/FixJ family response regulator